MSTTKHPLPIQNEIETFRQYAVRFKSLMDSSNHIQVLLRSGNEKAYFLEREIFDMDLKDFLNTEMGEGITMTTKL